MSFGDEIMASGHARVASRGCGGRVHIVGLDGRPRWNALWRGLDWIAAPREPAVGRVINGAGCRPYITYPFTRQHGHGFTRWRACDHVGALVLTPDEMTFAHRALVPPDDFVVIEPDLAATSNPNKQWGRERWAALVDLMPEVPLVQLLAPGRKPFHPKVRVVQTPTFRHAAAVLSLARAAVLPEGGLHHAAAVMGVAAVVLFGGATSVRATGYPWQVNLADESPRRACGSWRPCDHCAAWWAALRPATVADALHDVLAEQDRARFVRVERVAG